MAPDALLLGYEGFGVWPQDPFRVGVVVPADRHEAKPDERETFEVTRVLPLDASREDVFRGIGRPVLDWILCGFNALVLSYGQAGAGKTSLLHGHGSLSARAGGIGGGDGDGDRVRSSESDGRAGKAGAPASLRGQDGPHEAGLLEDILRALFDAVGSAVEESPGDVAGSGNVEAMLGVGGEALGLVAGNVRRGASKTAADAGVSDANTQEASADEGCRGETSRLGRYTVAFSAWDVSGKTVRDLLSSRPMGNGGSDSHRDKPSGGGGTGGGTRKSRMRNRDNNGNGSSRKGGGRRGRSGSDDSGSGGAPSSGYQSLGGPTGYPDGFFTVKAPDFATALVLLRTARRRSSESRQSGSWGDGSEGNAAGGGGRAGRGGGGGAAAGGAGARSGNTGPLGHVFFRVVLHDAVEETASTLHVVDLAGGWEPPSGNSGKRNSKPALAPGRVSIIRDINNFEAMLAGLALGDQLPCVHHAMRAAEYGGMCGVAGAGGEDGPGGSSGLPPAPQDERPLPYELPPPPPPPPPHPVYGSPRGRSGGGVGGGRLVEALRPLIAGNTRSWLVVSVGGGGRGGARAAWRALDVARRAVAVCTTCIRLKGVGLGDMRLRAASEVLLGDGEDRCRAGSRESSTAKSQSPSSSDVGDSGVDSGSLLPAWHEDACASGTEEHGDRTGVTASSGEPSRVEGSEGEDEKKGGACDAKGGDDDEVCLSFERQSGDAAELPGGNAAYSSHDAQSSASGVTVLPMTTRKTQVLSGGIGTPNGGEGNRGASEESRSFYVAGNGNVSSGCNIAGAQGIAGGTEGGGGEHSLEAGEQGSSVGDFVPSDKPCGADELGQTVSQPMGGISGTATSVSAHATLESRGDSGSNALARQSQGVEEEEEEEGHGMREGPISRQSDSRATTGSRIDSGVPTSSLTPQALSSGADTVPSGPRTKHFEETGSVASFLHGFRGETDGASYFADSSVERVDAAKSAIVGEPGKGSSGAGVLPSAASHATNGSCDDADSRSQDAQSSAPSRTFRTTAPETATSAAAATAAAAAATAAMLDNLDLLLAEGSRPIERTLRSKSRNGTSSLTPTVFRSSVVGGSGTTRQASAPTPVTVPATMPSRQEGVPVAGATSAVKGNVDRMMASLFGDLRRSRHGGGQSSSAAPPSSRIEASGDSDAKSADRRRSDPTLSITRSGLTPAAPGSHAIRTWPPDAHAVPPGALPAGNPPLPIFPSGQSGLATPDCSGAGVRSNGAPPASVASRPGGRAAGEASVFLTPVEVLMHVPARTVGGAVGSSTPATAGIPGQASGSEGPDREKPRCLGDSEDKDGAQTQVDAGRGQGRVSSTSSKMREQEEAGRSQGAEVEEVGEMEPPKREARKTRRRERRQRQGAPHQAPSVPRTSAAEMEMPMSREQYEGVRKGGGKPAANEERGHDGTAGNGEQGEGVRDRNPGRVVSTAARNDQRGGKGERTSKQGDDASVGGGDREPQVRATKTDVSESSSRSDSGAEQADRVGTEPASEDAGGSSTTTLLDNEVSPPSRRLKGGESASDKLKSYESTPDDEARRRPAGVAETKGCDDSGSKGCLGDEEKDGEESKDELLLPEALLLRNHTELLRVVQEQEERSKQMEARFRANESDWLERVTTLEATLEGLRAEAVEMRGRLRRAQSSSCSPELFARYESDLALLEQENSALRDRNISLEMRLLDLLRDPAATVRNPSGPLNHRRNASQVHGSSPVHEELEREGVEDPRKGVGRANAGAASAAVTRQGAPERSSMAISSARSSGGLDVSLERRSLGSRDSPGELPACDASSRGKSGASGSDRSVSDQGANGGERGVDHLRGGSGRRKTEIDGAGRASGRSGEVKGRVPEISPGANTAPQAWVGALRDLRRRLRAAEREARDLREERAAVDRRDRQCHAQLRTLSEQRSKVLELTLREREHESELTVSRLESARAEAEAARRAAKIERLQGHQSNLQINASPEKMKATTKARLLEEREALMLNLAEERRKSRRFDEDRRAYGHIKRFIERHAGGRPPEWDADSEGSADDGGGHEGHGDPRHRESSRVDYRGLAAGRDANARASTEQVRARSSGIDPDGGRGARATGVFRRSQERQDFSREKDAIRYDHSVAPRTPTVLGGVRRDEFDFAGERAGLKVGAVHRGADDDGDDVDGRVDDMDAVGPGVSGVRRASGETKAERGSRYFADRGYERGRYHGGLGSGGRRERERSRSGRVDGGLEDLSRCDRGGYTDVGFGGLEGTRTARPDDADHGDRGLDRFEELETMRSAEEELGLGRARGSSSRETSQALFARRMGGEYESGYGARDERAVEALRDWRQTRGEERARRSSTTGSRAGDLNGTF